MERCLPLARVILAFGMAKELISCLVRRVVGSIATFWRNLSCLMVTSLSMGGMLSLVLRMLSMETW